MAANGNCEATNCSRAASRKMSAKARAKQAVCVCFSPLHYYDAARVLCFFVLQRTRVGRGQRASGDASNHIGLVIGGQSMNRKETRNSHFSTRKADESRNKNIGIYLLFLVSIVLCVALVLFTYNNKTEKQNGSGQVQAEDSPQTLSVALYEYVPDLESVKRDISEAWKEAHPDVGLQFVSWSCYSDELPEDLDVFVFDAIYLSEYIEHGNLLPIPEETIKNKEDIIPFALDGCKEGGKLYAVPQILCTNLLYTRKEDTELSGVTDLLTLYEKMGDRELQTEIPEENEGLMIDMSGGTTKVCMYLDAEIDYNKTHTDYKDLPVQPSLTEETLVLLRLLTKMGGKAQVLYEPEDYEPYIRARWFSEGKGRAFIGFSEAMSVMGDYVNEIDFRAFSYSDSEDIPLLFADAIGVNSKIDESKKELAFDLAEIITCEETMYKVMAPEKSDGTPQYLLPARVTVYDRLKEDYPLYAGLEEIVLNPKNHLFRMGANAREYIANTKKVLPELIFSD